MASFGGGNELFSIESAVAGSKLTIGFKGVDVLKVSKLTGIVFFSKSKVLKNDTWSKQQVSVIKSDEEVGSCLSQQESTSLLRPTSFKVSPQ